MLITAGHVVCPIGSSSHEAEFILQRRPVALHTPSLAEMMRVPTLYRHSPRYLFSVLATQCSSGLRPLTFRSGFLRPGGQRPPL